VVAFVVAMVGFGSYAVRAQQSQRRMPSEPRPGIQNVDPLDFPPVYGGDPMQNSQNEKRLQYLNAERQKSMVAETNRLVKLAADLNAQINSGEHTQLTPDQARQLAEIEKLAHRIRDRMSTSVRPSPSLGPGPAFIPYR
jgi:hypothetical protein